MSEAPNPVATVRMADAYRPLVGTPSVADTPIPPGDIRFYDAYLPLLDAGDYTITVQQQIDSTDSAHPLHEAPTIPVQSFSVVAPRFALDPSEVQSVFPPANATGPFDQNLPHVVLHQRALPWERVLGPDLPVPPNPNVKAYPWLALLVFTEDQIIRPSGSTDDSSLANPTLVGTYPVSELRKPKDSAILGPDAPAQREDEPTCRAIDITTDTFTAVTPRQAELPYLAHARQVNVDQKTTSLALTSGWFSVVTANRFPVVGDDPEGTRNIVHLVSLEGFAKYLVDAPAWPQGIRKVRLASLASWVFTAQKEGADFRALMLALVAGQVQPGEGLRLRLPVPPRTSAVVDPGTPDGMVRTALERGFAALPYETRVGDETFAWYHGPFVPHPIPDIASAKAFASSAAATIYDPVSGTFDLSYAAAWELGRLVALSDAAYSTNQQRVRKSVRRLLNLVRERSRWADNQRLLANAVSDALDELVKPRQVSRSVAAFLGHRSDRLLATAAVSAESLRAYSRPERLGAHEGMAALHARADVQVLVDRHLHKTMSDGPGASVVDWLGGLRLLQGIPFVYLVPDARMLPTDSVRFFRVDTNVLEALCDGAQSVGVQSSRDAMQQHIVRGTMRQAAMRHAASRRVSLLRAPRASAALRAAVASTASAADPVAGFVLRSAAVSGWPGLEVKAFADVAGTEPLDAVRIDHVADDVLLALYPAVPARIELDEPKEGLAFGVEDDAKVGVRSLAGANIGNVIAEVTLAATYLRGNGVVKVDAWQQYLAKQLPAASAALWGPAGYAIQMVRAPEQMVFDNGGLTT